MEPSEHARIGSKNDSSGAEDPPEQGSADRGKVDEIDGPSSQVRQEISQLLASFGRDGCSRADGDVEVAVAGCTSSSHRTKDNRQLDVLLRCQGSLEGLKVGIQGTKEGRSIGGYYQESAHRASQRWERDLGRKF